MIHSSDSRRNMPSSVGKIRKASALHCSVKAEAYEQIEKGLDILMTSYDDTMSRHNRTMSYWRRCHSRLLYGGPREAL